MINRFVKEINTGTAIRISIARVSGEHISIVGSIKDWKIMLLPGETCVRDLDQGWEWSGCSGWGAFQKCHLIRTSVHILGPEFDILATYPSSVEHFSDTERRKVALFPGNGRNKCNREKTRGTGNKFCQVLPCPSVI